MKRGTATLRRKRAGGRMIEVARVRITDAGRQAVSKIDETHKKSPAIGVLSFAGRGDNLRCAKNPGSN
jgi:hypothetical protein